MDVYYSHDDSGGDVSRKYTIEDCARDLFEARDKNPNEMAGVPIPDEFKAIGVQSGMICCHDAKSQKDLEHMMRVVLNRITERKSSGEYDKRLNEIRAEMKRVSGLIGF